jgi:ubiquinone/menaquinone biosynthesis C-methylase UbiE
MANTIDMGLQAGAHAVRFGLYFGLSRVMSRQADRLGLASRYKAQRPVPPVSEILADLGRLCLRDAAAVRDGLYPPTTDEGGLFDTISRVRAMLADLPDSGRRRAERDAGTVRAEAGAERVPDYYAQDFHFQTGGYLSEESARLYDVQVETLFLGGAAPMRREALRPIAEFMRGRDQRRVSLLDIACGTGRFLRDVRLAYPAMQLTGLDMSPAYLDEARRHMDGLRPAKLIVGNAEAIPLADASQDIVTSTFLFHELPPDVRRTVAREMARVLKPGGLLVFIDSLQMGDRPGWDGLLEAFPERFHEPYFRQYAIDDLEGLFHDAGVEPAETWTAFFSKVMVLRRV